MAFDLSGGGMMDETGGDDVLSADLNATVAALAAVRQQWRAAQMPRRLADRFPSTALVETAIADLTQALFPKRLGDFVGTEVGEDAFVAARLS